MSTSQQPGAAMEAAKPPVRPGAITAVGLLLAIVTCVLGVALVREALAWAGVDSGEPWLKALARRVNGIVPDWWLIPIGVVLVLLGLYLLVLALRRRPRPTTELDTQTGVFLRTSDVARLSRGVAENVSGVISARASASRNAVTVDIRGTGDAAVSSAVESAVRERLSALRSAPTVSVRETHTTQEGAR